MPTVTIDESPLIPALGGVAINYREIGEGNPLLFLHGGWGYEVYPFDRQAEVLKDRFRIIIPDRSGYGKSLRIDHVPSDFHQRAAVETLRVIDALHLKKPLLWGHSDGAVIAMMIALNTPDRIRAVILEAFHFYRDKPASREFFQTMAGDPGLFGERVVATLSRDHGEDNWRKLIRMNGRAWLQIAEEASESNRDLYDGRLNELTVPTLFLHGSRDPRTEPGEMEAASAQASIARLEIIEGGGHSPHSESAAFGECNRLALEFIQTLAD